MPYGLNRICTPADAPEEANAQAEVSRAAIKIADVQQCPAGGHASIEFVTVLSRRSCWMAERDCRAL